MSTPLHRSAPSGRTLLHRARNHLLFSSALLLLSGTARAQARAVDLVPLLQPLGAVRHHPLADRRGRVPLIVAPEQSLKSKDLLPIAEGLYAIRLAPDELSAFMAKHPGMRVGIHPPKRILLDASSELIRAPALRHRTGLDGQGVVIGIIDTGIDAAHGDFRRDDGSSRIAWMLDMSTNPLGEVGHGTLEQSFGCNHPHQSPCRILDAKMIDAALEGGPIQTPQDPVGHGTHVASIAAGSHPKYTGVAPGASLVIANVTQAFGHEASDIDIVTAARFVFDRAEAMGMPAVVNISLGGDFGPHDGSSPLEKGLASLVGPEYPGRAIVVAAGNSGGLYADSRGRVYGVHTEARVVPQSPNRIRLLVPGRPKDRELRGQAYIWIALRPGDDISIGLEGPGGEKWIDQVSYGSSVGYSAPGLDAAIIHGVEGELSPMTSDTHGAIVAISGALPSGSEITLNLEGIGTPKLWIQGGGELSPHGTPPGILFEGATSEGTITTPATHPDLIAVGCTLGRASWDDASGRPRVIESLGGRLAPIADSSCYFSSAGPTATGVQKPEISAPGAFIAAAMSEEARPRLGTSSIFDAPPGFCDEFGACFLVSDHHALLSGTSMSAPQVAGAIALLLQRDPSLNQAEITKLLQAGARRPRGDVPYDYQLGPGALDIEGTVRAHELLRTPSSNIVDAQTSWMSLSASYARPDPDWPVVGTVELRSKDGEVIDGFDPSRLTLDVDNGIIRKDLHRIAPGLFRFEVAGASESGQTTMHIEVRLDGEIVGELHPSLSGRRSLPIGVDRWVANGELVAAGGCELSPGTRAGRGAWPWALWLGLWTMWRRGRGRVDRSAFS